MTHSPLTARQAAFIKNLLAERVGYSAGFRARVENGIATEAMTRQEARRVIDWMLALEKAPKPAAAPVPAGTPEITVGFWIADTEDATSIDVWKAQKSAKGVYGRRLHVHPHPDKPGKFKGTFVYEPGGVAKMRARNPRPFTVDEAKAYGKLHGVCARCGASLTVEDSVERMMGPVCWKKTHAIGAAL